MDNHEIQYLWCFDKQRRFVVCSIIIEKILFMYA